MAILKPLIVHRSTGEKEGANLERWSRTGLGHYYLTLCISSENRLALVKALPEQATFSCDRCDVDSLLFRPCPDLIQYVTSGGKRGRQLELYNYDRTPRVDDRRGAGIVFVRLGVSHHYRRGKLDPPLGSSLLPYAVCNRPAKSNGSTYSTS